MSEDVSAVPWVSLPLRHPNIFSSILLHCDPPDLLHCRATCSTWFSWFSSSKSIWSKLVSVMVQRSHNQLPSLTDIKYQSPNDYRLTQLISQDTTEGEKDAMFLCLRLFRSRLQTTPTIDPNTMQLVGFLESRVRVLGPPAIFVRLKVDHPVVQQVVREAIGNLLSSVILDRRDSNKDVVKATIFRSMPRGQNWAYVTFPGLSKEQEAEEGENVGCLHARVLSGDQLENALKLSLQPSSQWLETEEEDGQKKKGQIDKKFVEIGERTKNLRGEKRKHEDDETVEENKNDEKRPKVEFQTDEDKSSDDSEDFEEEEGYGSEPQASIYAIENTTNVDPDFPSILELIDIDHPVIKELLLSRRQVNSCLVVPQFLRFLNYKSLLNKTTKCLLFGRDSDGRVASVNPATFNSCDKTMVGYIDNVSCVGPVPQLEFWGGPDIRNRWPEFADHLSRIDKEVKVPSKKAAGVCSLNMKVTAAKPSSGAAGNVPNNTNNSDDIMAMLAARGINVSRK